MKNLESEAPNMINFGKMHIEHSYFTNELDFGLYGVDDFMVRWFRAVNLVANLFRKHLSCFGGWFTKQFNWLRV